MHGSFYQEEIVKGPQADVQKIDEPAGFQRHGDLPGIGIGETACGMHFIGIEPYPQGEVGSHHFADSLDHFQTEPHAVFKASAIGIGPEIGGRGQKLPYERTVAQLEFNTVKFPFHHV